MINIYNERMIGLDLIDNGREAVAKNVELVYR